MPRRTFHLTFPSRVVSEPLLHRMHAEFGLVANIRRARIDEDGGWVILDLAGTDDDLQRCLEWLAGQGVDIDRIAEDA